jgi:ParB/RepB/Spo0J family partition protein
MTTVKQRLSMVPIADLLVGDNIRDDVGDITSLAESIGQIGMLEPIVVWPSEDGKHAEVGMGQRRLAAARAAGLTEVPCILRARPDERDRILMQLAENHERADMSPIDEAHAFKDLIRLGISRRALARSLHKSETWVYHRIKLLDFPKVLREAIHVGVLPPAVALEFPLALADDKEAMARLAKIGTLYLSKDAMRAFVRGEYQRRSVPGSAGQSARGGIRTVGVTVDAYEVAVAGAKAARQALGEWVTTAIHEHARNGR